MDTLMKKSIKFCIVSLLLWMIVSMGGCITTVEHRPKLTEDFVTLNKPGTRETAFMSDFMQGPIIKQQVWSKIDPNNTFITRVVVEWGDSPSGGGEPWFGITEEALPESPNMKYTGDSGNYRTDPGIWSAYLPIRENMSEGSKIYYQFHVFYKLNTSSSAPTISTWLGERTLVFGPPSCAFIPGVYVITTCTTRLEPLNLPAHAGEVGSAEVKLYISPSAPLTVHFYTDPEGALQVLNEQGQPIDRVIFNRNESVKAIQIKANQAGEVVLWAKASGWMHDTIRLVIN